MQDLVQNRHVPRADNIDTVLQFVQKDEQQESRTSRFRYYVIRCQERALENRLSLLRNRYPNMRLLKPEYDDVNALHYWNRFQQEKLTQQDYFGNHFNVPEDMIELYEGLFV